MIERIAEELRALERENGRLSPSEVVERARDPESAMHDHFTWDDSEAADKYRLQQARSLIRRVQIELVVHDVPLSVVRYVRDPDADAKTAGYRNILSLRSEADSARLVIVDEMKRVANAVRRAKAVAAALDMIEDIEEIERAASAIATRATLDQPSAEA